MICTLLNLHQPRPNTTAVRLWLHPGQTCAIGRGHTLRLEVVRDDAAGTRHHRVRITGPGMAGVFPACAILNLGESAGVRVTPRAIEEDGAGRMQRLFLEFSDAGIVAELRAAGGGA